MVEFLRPSLGALVDRTIRQICEMSAPFFESYGRRDSQSEQLCNVPIWMHLLEMLFEVILTRPFLVCFRTAVGKTLPVFALPVVDAVDGL